MAGISDLQRALLEDKGIEELEATAAGGGTNLGSESSLNSVSFLAGGHISNVMSGIGDLRSIAKKTQNLIIKADALHYKSDFFTNLGIIAALVVIKFTGLTIIDAVFGVVISGYIVNSAIALMKDSFGVLLDKALEPQIVVKIEEIISSKKEIKSFHGLATRKSSDICYMSVHLVFDKEISLFKAHEISNEIEDEIRVEFGEFRWEITTHLDPYDDRV